MKKYELIEMLKNIKDDEEIRFVVDGRDYEGYPKDELVNVYKVIGENAKKVRKEYGIKRYE